MTNSRFSKITQWSFWRYSGRTEAARDDLRCCSMAKNLPERHHYVPKFYQRGFAEGHNQLWMLRPKSAEVLICLPRKYLPCCENDMYTIDPKGQRDPRIRDRMVGKD